MDGVFGPSYNFFCTFFEKRAIFGEKYLYLYCRVYLKRNKAMKKLLFLMLATVFCGGFVACDKDDDATSQSIEHLLGSWELVLYQQNGNTVSMADEDRLTIIEFETLGKGTLREKARDEYGQWYDQTMVMDWNLTSSRLTVRCLDGERRAGVITSLESDRFILDYGDGYVEHYSRNM